MIVNVRGFSPCVEQAEWREASRWFGEYLLGIRMARNIRLNIELSDYMRGKCGAIGCAAWRRPRNFLIQIDTGSGKRMKQLCTLAHEMVHMKQIVRGELKLGSMGLVWRSKGVDGIFRDEPWEKEAYERERELYHLFQRR